MGVTTFQARLSSGGCNNRKKGVTVREGPLYLSPASSIMAGISERHGPVTVLEIFWQDRRPILDGT